MSKKNESRKSPDGLAKGSKRAAIELSETELDKVAGGGNNQATTAQKAADKADSYIRS